MEAVDFPFALEQVFFTKSIVIALQGHDPANAKIGTPSNAVNVMKIDEAQELYQVTMRSTMNEEKDKAYPYMVDMEVVAMIRMVGNLSAEKIGPAVLQLGHTVCYGAIRESLAWITGRHPYGSLLLGFSVLQPGRPEPQQG